MPLYIAESTLIHIKNRLRAYIPPQAISDDELLRYVSEGYQQLVELGGVFQAVVTVPDVADQAEYDLPADHFQTLRVYRAGVRQAKLPDFTAFDGLTNGYYEYGSKLGVSPTPGTTDGTTYLLYSRTPDAPLDWNDDLDPDFPAEFSYAIVHYVHWRIGGTIGGEARISQIQWHKSQWDAAVGKLRRRMLTTTRARVGMATGPRSKRPTKVGVFNSRRP